MEVSDMWAYASSEHSDQPELPRSLVRGFAVRPTKNFGTLDISCGQRRLKQTAHPGRTGSVGRTCYNF